MNAPVTDVLTNELSDIAWKIAGVIIVAGCLGLIWKVIEHKVMVWIDRKNYERKQRNFEETSSHPKIEIERKEPTFEEWKAAKLAEQKKQ